MRPTPPDLGFNNFQRQRALNNRPSKPNSPTIPRPPKPPIKTPPPALGLAPGAGALGSIGGPIGGAIMLGIMIDAYLINENINALRELNYQRNNPIKPPTWTNPPADRDNGNLNNPSGFPGRSYEVVYEICYARSGTCEEHISGPFEAPIRGYRLQPDRLRLYTLHSRRGEPEESSSRSTNPGNEMVKVRIIKLIEARTNQEYPPPTDTPQNSRNHNSPPPLTEPLSPPGTDTPPTNPAPGQNPNNDDGTRRGPFNPGTKSTPGSSPGQNPNNDDGTRRGPFNPSPGTNPPNRDPGFEPFPPNLTAPGFNPLPGVPGFDPLEPFVPPALSPSSPPTFNKPPTTQGGLNSPPTQDRQLAPPLLTPGNDPINNPGLTPVPGQAPEPVNTEPDRCHAFNRCSSGLQQGQKNLNDKLDSTLTKIDAGLDAAILAVVNQINGKMGDALPGGLSGWLTGKFKKLWESKVIDRAINLLTLAASIHNAVMLSRNIGETLASALTNVLTLIGIKDPDGKVHNIQEAIGQGIEDAIKGIIGADNYTELTETWKKANRIYQAAINTYQLLNDSMFAVAEGLEVMGQYTGKIGNALKKSGSVLESAYDWMNEKFNLKSSKNRAIDKVIDGLQQASTVASDLEEITAEFREAQENINEIGEQMNIIKTELKAETDDKNEKETDSKTDSQTPDIPPSSMIKPSPPSD